MHDPYEVLGLQAGAGRSELNRAYQQHKELYAQGSLAIYSLLTNAERKDRLEEIEAAFRSIIGILREPPGDHVAGEAGGGQPAPTQETVLSPGAYLRWAREQAGLSIRQLADRTKIGYSTLEDIEAERVDRLPPRVYLRGFVYEFARCLDLADASELSEFYLKLLSHREE